MPARVHVVRDDFARLAVALHREAAAVVEDTARQIESRAKGHTSARIAKTIGTDTDRGGLRATVYAGDKDQAIHAGFIEYGAAHTPARPFLTPAAEAEESQFRSRLRSVLHG
jgi:HK97 gp10 family phage protein